MPDLELGQLLARNLKQLRTLRGLSLGDLSKLTGISKAILSDMEKGTGNPTINTLWKLAAGLNVPYTRLLEQNEEEGAVVRRADVLAQSEEAEHLRAFYYFKITPSRDFELVRCELDGLSEHQTAGHGANTQEFIFLLSGQLTLRTQRKAYKLEAGDALSFDSSARHVYVNTAAETAHYLCINYYPGKTVMWRGV